MALEKTDHIRKNMSYFKTFFKKNLSGPIRLYYSAYLFLNKKLGHDCLLVLNMGKVGSSSIYYSLKKQLNTPVLHIHRYSDEGVQKAIARHQKSKRGYIPINLIVAQEYKKMYAKQENRIKIITIIREPIGRRISSFFQNLSSRYTVDLSGIVVEKLADDILGDIKHDPYREQEWLDSELRQFSINVFANEFNVNKGFQIYEGYDADLLLIRMEDLSNVFMNAISEFMGLDRIHLINKNIGEKKYYSEIYKKVKKEFVLPKEMIELMTSSTYFEHFYKDKDQEIKQKWSG